MSDVRRQAALSLDRVLALVASGELQASTAAELALVRRLEGAAVALLVDSRLARGAEQR